MEKSKGIHHHMPMLLTLHSQGSLQMPCHHLDSYGHSRIYAKQFTEFLVVNHCLRADHPPAIRKFPWNGKLPLFVSDDLAVQNLASLLSLEGRFAEETFPLDLSTSS